MSRILACIDGSLSSKAVCDCAAWASQRIEAPLTFLHVLDRRQYPTRPDLSGTIGLGSREHLLAELAALDQQRSKLATEQGRLMLEAARERATTAGATAIDTLQRHGSLVDTLLELEEQTRLIILGKHGVESDSLGNHVGGHLESVARAVHRPILVSPAEFEAPRSVLFAFDGSATTRKGVEMLAERPLLRGLPVHLLMVGAATDDARAQLEWAEGRLRGAGYEVEGQILPGEVQDTLLAYQDEHELDLLVMGAYGHSRIRELLVGSSTSRMIRQVGTPMLLLR